MMKNYVLQKKQKVLFCKKVGVHGTPGTPGVDGPVYVLYIYICIIYIVYVLYIYMYVYILHFTCIIGVLKEKIHVSLEGVIGKRGGMKCEEGIATLCAICSASDLSHVQLVLMPCSMIWYQEINK